MFSNVSLLPPLAAGDIVSTVIVEVAVWAPKLKLNAPFASSPDVIRYLTRISSNDSGCTPKTLLQN